MRCGSSGRQDRVGIGRTVRGSELRAEPKVATTRRRCAPGTAADAEQLLAQARETGDRVVAGRRPGVNAAMRWTAQEHEPNRYVGVAGSGRLAALGFVERAHGWDLTLSVWDADGNLVRARHFAPDAIELALVELEFQGDEPAVLVHPSVHAFD